jgi:hypothetical protein
MKQVPVIKAAYKWMIAAYQTEVATAVAAGDTRAVDRLGEKRDAIERGIFVMLFAQFETEVTDCFRTARDTRSRKQKWADRRGWDVPVYQGSRTPFETRLALVLDKNDPSYNGIMHAYKIRNHFAHGGATLPIGSIDQFANDLYTWQGLLTK